MRTPSSVPARRGFISFSPATWKPLKAHTNKHEPTREGNTITAHTATAEATISALHAYDHELDVDLALVISARTETAILYTYHYPHGRHADDQLGLAAVLADLAGHAGAEADPGAALEEAYRRIAAGEPPFAAMAQAIEKHLGLPAIAVVVHDTGDDEDIRRLRSAWDTDLPIFHTSRVL